MASSPSSWATSSSHGASSSKRTRSTCGIWIFSVLVACGGSNAPAKKIDAPIDIAVQACTSCNATTQFCYEQAAGVAPVEPVVGCNAMPPACATMLTCACLTANTTTVCGTAVTCSGEGSLLTLTCMLP